MTDSDYTIGRRKVIQALGAAGIAGLAGCGGGNGNGGNGNGNGGNGNGGTGGNGNGGNGMDGTTTDGMGGEETIRAAWLYVSETGDLGWSTAHDNGRKAVAQKYDWLETDFTEAVTPDNSSRVLEQYASDGYDVIFGTTFGYMDPMKEMAGKYPDTIFEHCSGYLQAENMGRYFGKIYQPRYLAGQAAGMVTENNTIGYVAAFPIPEVVRSINAMTLGARSVNPEATFKVRWVNAWFDPPKSKEAANSLLDENCDVIAQEQDSPAAVKAAADAGVWASGYNAPMGEFGGEKYLISPVWNWEEFYDPAVVSVHDGTWESDFFWGDMNTGVPDLDEWGPNVPQEVKDTVASTRSDIESGDLDVWAGSKFEGEDETFLFQEMSSFVEGVEGTVPS